MSEPCRNRANDMKLATTSCEFWCECGSFQRISNILPRLQNTENSSENIAKSTQFPKKSGAILELLARFELATSSLPTTFGTSQGTSANHIKMRISIDNTRV